MTEFVESFFTVDRIGALLAVLMSPGGPLELEGFSFPHLSEHLYLNIGLNGAIVWSSVGIVLFGVSLINPMLVNFIRTNITNNNFLVITLDNIVIGTIAMTIRPVMTTQGIIAQILG